jgi:hypothetical protein
MPSGADGTAWNSKLDQMPRQKDSHGRLEAALAHEVRKKTEKVKNKL